MYSGLNLAKEVQYYASLYLNLMSPPVFTDVEDWHELQTKLTNGIKKLDEWEGRTPDEEAERVLAILMGYCVAVRDNKRIQRALAGAERVLPRIQDLVLKCYLAVFCYMECPDEELGEVIRKLMEQLKRTDRADEVEPVERLMMAM